MKPPFTYFGGKTSIAERIAALLPPHEHYVEPFAGSLAVLLAKRQVLMETVNDLDKDLMNFWQVLRDQPAALERACALTPHSRAEYAAAFEDASDAIEQARRVWVRLTQGRGHGLSRSGWRHFQNPEGAHGRSRPGRIPAERIEAAAARIARVTLECRPAIEVIEAYGRHDGVLIYADPPYLGSVRNGTAYACDMRSEREHQELATALTAARAAVILSGYHSPLYDGLYDGWHRAEIRTSSGNASVRARTEVLWSNRPFPATQADLFSEEAS